METSHCDALNPHHPLLTPDPANSMILAYLCRRFHAQVRWQMAARPLAAVLD